MALRRRVVLFDIGGVLMFPGPQQIFRRYEESLRLPRDFLKDVIVKGGSDGPLARAERGHITFSKLLSELEDECKIFAASAGITLPAEFSVGQAFREVHKEGQINRPLLQAAVTLRNRGFKTCILTNNWIDDSPQREFTAQFCCLIRPHFDVLIESCRIGMRKPEPKIYKYVLEMLKAEPQEVIFLDDIGANLKSARELGISTILVQDTETALKELQDLTGIQLTSNEDIPPTACHSENVTHGFVPIKPGVKLHFVEMGNGPVVCLCHGFPECWFSWRYQIPALADAGFRVLALDMKGYGDSSAPPDPEEYSQEEMCKELVTFLDKLGISQATFIGHDWGGSLTWNMSLFYPERVRAVAGINTPFFPCDPKINQVEKLKNNPIFDYQFYFQKPGPAEKELEECLERTFKIMFRGIKAEDRLSVPLTTSNVQQRGGLFVGLPDVVPRSTLLGETEFQYYIQQFKKSGFRGPLNWYRNMEKNWQWSCSAADRKILVPALMVTAGKDFVLLPQMSKGMEDWIPNLKRGHIEECGHWTPMERPGALNEILINWLKEVHYSSSSSCSKL
uniref:Bifunctional epoxide hydrolase 2 n=1 Tax=Geotrypetes seraphini TaxID=260995 RepID=A0A6P8Q2W1_GEOSA|nr:bifunctional epoxide hydrolase 2 [Geotrypetes seraphini]